MVVKDKIIWRFNLHLSIPLLFLLLLSTNLVNAQAPIAFKNYSTLNGLSHNIVRKTIMDTEGFMWIATQDGLNKFNGHSFEIYKVGPDDSTSISSNKIITLAEDKYHNIWIGTWGGGICIYNRELDNFKRILPLIENGASAETSTSFISDLFLDRQQRMWVGTARDGLLLADQDNYTFRQYLHNSTDTLSLSNNKINSITQDESGKLWIGTGRGLNHFDPQTGKFNVYKHQKYDPQGLSSNEIYKVFYDSKHRLWVGTFNDGLNLMTEQAGRFLHFINQPNIPGSICNDQIWAINETPDGKIWIGTDNGLAMYDEVAQSFITYLHDPFDPRSLAANSVKDLYIDPQQRLWISTYTGGISLFDKSLVQFQHFYATMDQNSLSSNDVSSFLQLPSGKVMIGTDGGGLNIFDRATGQFKHYRHQFNNPSSLGSDKVLSVLQDSKNRIWISFWNGGLDYFDQQRQTFKHYTQEMGFPQGPSSNNITRLTEDKEGYIWMSTFDGGLNRFDPEQGTFEYFTRDNKHPNNISDNQIWAVLADSNNDIWVGTNSGTLNKLDRATGSFIHIDTKGKGESNYSILSLFEDAKGRLWVGLEGGGLKLFNRKDNSFQTFSMEDGLPSNSINAIKEDQKGYLWLSTNHGISRFNPATRRCKNYDLSDGLQSLYFNRNASLKLASGEILFGGPNGFNLFHPDSLKYFNRETPIVFTNFHIFNHPVPIGTRDSPLKAHINETDAITLSYKQSVFSIEYASLNFTTPEKTQYKYRLKGFVDESWQEVGQERKVTYTNLQPREYVFEVAVADTSLVQPIRSLPITVTPPWWQTWWARLLTGMLLMGIVFAIYKLRLQNIQKQNKKLEKEVAERTISLKKANDAMRKKNILIQEQNGALIEKNKLIQEQKEEIQAQAEELQESNEEIHAINQSLEERVEIRTADLKKSNQELDNFVYRVSHDIRAPLSSVLGLLGLMENETRPEQIGQYMKMAIKSIDKLDGFVRDILAYSRNARMEVDRQPINFKQLVDSSLDDLQHMENGHRLQIIRELPANGNFCSDPKRLHVIFRNLLSNAIKYQNAHIDNPYLKIKVQPNTEGVFIKVEDNGIGIGEAQIEKVFDMFYRGSNLSNGSGIGLYIVKETVEKLGGRIYLESQVGEGSIFTITLPSIVPGD